MELPDWVDPLLDADQMRRTDAWTIDHHGVDSLELMENAGRAVAEAAADLVPDGPVAVVCGKGNNGGDGLVVARLLAATGREVRTLLLWPTDELSPDAATNLERLASEPVVRTDGEIGTDLAGAALIIDAIFGTGFEGAPRSPADAAIRAIDESGVPVVACDLASGVNGSTGEIEGDASAADLTVSFHAAKPGQLINPGKRAAGDLRVADIGIRAGAPVEPDSGLISARVLSGLPKRGGGSSKFSSGRVVLVGGSRGMSGAIAMAAAAAIRAGAGYATAVVPAAIEPVIEAKLTEVMSVGLGGGAAFGPADLEAALAAADGADAVVVGPGLGRDEGTREFVVELVGSLDSPLVLDADGLFPFSGELSRLGLRQTPTVITPHAGELGRLLGSDSATIADRRLASAREAAELSGAMVVLKGDDTIVTDGTLVAINDHPSPALATAGTGDVLAGMVAALIARGVQPYEASCAAVLAHTEAGRAAARSVGAPESVIATDVVAAIPAGLAHRGEGR